MWRYAGNNTIMKQYRAEGVYIHILQTSLPEVLSNCLTCCRITGSTHQPTSSECIMSTRLTVTEIQVYYLRGQVAVAKLVNLLFCQLLLLKGLVIVWLPVRTQDPLMTEAIEREFSPDTFTRALGLFVCTRNSGVFLIFYLGNFLKIFLPYGLCAPDERRIQLPVVATFDPKYTK